MTRVDRRTFRTNAGGSSEFQLALACCHRAFAGGERSARKADEVVVDWERFVRTVRFHRVQGLVLKGLSGTKEIVPVAVSKALLADTRLIVADNLRLIIEVRELREALDRAGVAALFVKGLTLGALAYPDPLLKMGWDIDLLVDPAQLAASAAALQTRGYQLIVPSSLPDLHSWHEWCHESLWKNEHRVFVELHGRLSEIPQLIPGIDVYSRQREVELAPGIRVPTLALEELFTYLCVHGASSLWFRLKWITDLAAVLHPLAPASIETLYARSQELGAGRASGYALLLADRLYGSLGHSSLRAKLAADRVNRLLVKMAMRQLAGASAPREPTDTKGGTASIHLSQMFLLPGWRFKSAELARQLRAWRSAKQSMAR